MSYLSDRRKMCKEWFKKHSDEYLEFDSIQNENKLNQRPDICGLMYLQKRFGGNDFAIKDIAGEDVLFSWRVSEIDLVEEDVLYLTRCGFHYDKEHDSLAMLV